MNTDLLDQKHNYLEGALSMPIGQLGLSKRGEDYCNRNGIKYVGQLVKKTYRDFRGVSNFGRCTLRSMGRRLAVYGLSLGMETAWSEPKAAELPQPEPPTEQLLLSVFRSQPEVVQRRIMATVLSEIAQTYRAE